MNHDCQKCIGSGRVWTDAPYRASDGRQFYIGYHDVACPACAGQGRVKQEETNDHTRFPDPAHGRLPR